MENFEMEWENAVRTIKINATVEEREKIEELKKLLKEAWKEKSEYAKEVEVLKEKVFGLETNIKILKGETIKYLDNGELEKMVILGFRDIIAGGDTREIGKFLAYPTERKIAPKWLKETCEIETVPAPNDNKGQQEKYDLLSTNGLRIQVKYRGGKTLHLEQTRRTTGKNKNAGAHNGQVRYSTDSFDVVLIVIPTIYSYPDQWNYLAIPISDLENVNKPGFCVGEVPAGVKNKFTGKAKETMVSLENSKRGSQQQSHFQKTPKIFDFFPKKKFTGKDKETMVSLENSKRDSQQSHFQKSPSLPGLYQEEQTHDSSTYKLDQESQNQQMGPDIHHPLDCIETTHAQEVSQVFV